MKVLAVDVSKDELVRFDGRKRPAVLNAPKSIAEMLKQYPKDWMVVMEPTSTYHLELACRAHKAGHTVYLVNPRAMSKFRESRSFRAKTDEIDAECLHEYCLKHSDRLRPWSPLPAELERLRSLLKRYHKVVQARVKLTQTLEGYKSPEVRRALEELGALAEKLFDDAKQAAMAVDKDYFERLLKTPGFGPYSACGFVFLMGSREFESPDAVRAFMGLDLKVRDSGKKKGKRCITKFGDSMLRHAGTCAGRGLLNSKFGRDVNLNLKALGREHPERMVIATRKQIRTAYALHKSGEPFDPDKFTWRVDKKT